MRGRFAIGVTILALTASAAAQRPAKKSEWQLQQERLETARQKAMAEDGLGDEIIIDSRPSVLFYRTGYSPPTWGHTEPRGDVMGPWPDKVSVTWATDGTGQLVIDSAPLYNRTCRLEGTIAADRTTIAGTAICDGDRLPLIGRIDRHNQCKGFDGRWGGRGGPVVLTVSDNRVTGTFGNGGAITGTLSNGGRTLDGEWADETGRGRVQLNLGREDQSYYGVWWRPDGSRSDEPWNGSCAGLR